MKPTPDKDITCPFCGEENYDKIGLKHHLLNSCEVFDTTISPEEEQRIREMKRTPNFTKNMPFTIRL